MTAPMSASDKMANAQIAEALEAALPAIMMDARRAAASIVMGEHGKKRAGLGDAFWQHREWTNGESIRQVDWRRSARSDKLFVRERERQVPALLQIWCDGRAGMNWASDTQTPTKAQRGLVISLALAIATRAGGERVGALGVGTPLNNELQFAHVLVEAGQDVPRKFQPGQVLLVSDGLEEPEVWAARAKEIGGSRAQLIVVLVADRAEQEFPFQGRVAFSAGSTQPPLIIGRAQAAKADYIGAYRQHLDNVERAIVSGGGQVFSHVTCEPAMPTLLRIARALDGSVPRNRAA